MAERRMISKTLVTSDRYLDLPQTSQLLYFHLLTQADDDGFVGNPRSVMRLIGVTKEDLQLLIKEGLLLSFDSGIVLIRHWKVHNYIRKDIYVETKYTDEKQQVFLSKHKLYEKISEHPDDTPDNGDAASLHKQDVTPRKPTADLHEQDVTPHRQTIASSAENSLTLTEQAGQHPSVIHSQRFPENGAQSHSQNRSQNHAQNRSQNHSLNHAQNNAQSHSSVTENPSGSSALSTSTQYSIGKVSSVQSSSEKNSSVQCSGSVKDSAEKDSSVQCSGAVQDSAEKDGLIQGSAGSVRVMGQCTSDNQPLYYTNIKAFDEAINKTIVGNRRTDTNRTGHLHDDKPGYQRCQQTADNQHNSVNLLTPVFTIPAKNGRFIITEGLFRDLEQSYPRLEILQKLRKIRQYLESHPQKQRLSTATEQYIRLWLSEDEKKLPPETETTAMFEKNIQNYESHSVIYNDALMREFFQEDYDTYFHAH